MGYDDMTEGTTGLAARSYSQLTEETETPYSLHVPVTERVATSLVALLAGYD